MTNEAASLAMPNGGLGDVVRLPCAPDRLESALDGQCSPPSLEA
jgi:hypothetical protein